MAIFAEGMRLQTGVVKFQALGIEYQSVRHRASVGALGHGSIRWWVAQSVKNISETYSVAKSSWSWTIMGAP